MQLKDLLLKKRDRQVPHKSIMLRLIFCFVNAFLFAATAIPFRAKVTAHEYISKGNLSRLLQQNLCIHKNSRAVGKRSRVTCLFFVA